ncbi:MAG: metallophosphoesterase [Oligoflexia bacterium]|nr:metallophosphoesterase [Oligoflexia bacterium]
MEKVKFIISDCHLSAGRFYEGQFNPHEDFHYDNEMCDLFDYFSTGQYGEGSTGPVDVELIINGDFLDFLNVPYRGEFEDAITENMALAKLEAIIAGHPKVMSALKRFASKANKRITYLIGNHDADLFFPKVRERIIREWDPSGNYPSDKVQIIADRDRIRYEGGVEIHHGNQFEWANALNFDQPVIEGSLPEPILNIPWGSFYVLKIVNRLKWEREYLDKIRPVRIFMILGFIFDPVFTFKYGFLTLYYFLKTRLTQGFKSVSKVLRHEMSFFLDLESYARQTLDQDPELKTIIFGHTHKPMDRTYPDGKQYINTGTWTKMINLDLQSFGQQPFRLTFALIRIRDGQAQCELRNWVGEYSPHRVFQG